MGTAIPPGEKYMGMRPCGRVLGLAGGHDSMAPGATNGAVGDPAYLNIYVSEYDPP